MHPVHAAAFQLHEAWPGWLALAALMACTVANGRADPYREWIRSVNTTVALAPVHPRSSKWGGYSRGC